VSKQLRVFMAAGIAALSLLSVVVPASAADTSSAGAAAATSPAGRSAGTSEAKVGPTPAAIFTDPPHDAKFPARMDVLHIPTHGVEINGVAYVPPGQGPHPALVIFHGLPGNEKNLDLAQSVRRAGWVAVTFNYRGSWGSPGTFSFAGNLEDGQAVLAYLRDPGHAKSLGIDPQRIAIAGHSMGGWVVARTGARDPKLLGVAMICGADMGRLGTWARDKTVKEMAENKEALAGVTAESMADEVIRNHEEFSFATPAAAEGLSKLPLLVLTTDDGLAPDGDGLVKAVRAKGSKQVVTRHVATDHGWSDRRILLQAIIINWLQTLH
jgi:uncharacterized protein